MTKQYGVAEVARLAGVSTATVSNVLNRPEVVAPSTQERVLAAIEQLDFVPNRAAATLRQGRARLLGLVLPDIANTFYADVTSAVADAADREGYVISLCVSHDDPEREQRQLEVLAEQRAAGVIVIPLTADTSRLSHLRLIGSRPVFIDRVAPVADACSVAVDDVLGGLLAVRHLAHGGARRITLVNGHTSIPQCRDRREGALRALAEAGLGPEALVEYPVDDMSVDAGRAIGARLVADAAPRAVFCTNDQLAIGTIHGLTDSDVRVPRQATVVGYGDLAMAAESFLPLTTVRQPKEELGRVAVRLVLDEVLHPTAHKHETVLLKPELVVRDSARHPAR